MTWFAAKGKGLPSSLQNNNSNNGNFCPFPLATGTTAL